MPLPSIVSIEFLHRRYAGSEEEFNVVFTHCRIVSAIAEQLIAARNLPVDSELVKAGALLHDIGVYRLQEGEAYIRHGVLGFQILRNENIEEPVERFAACHTGVGITKAEIEAQHLPLPPADYVPATTEERLVAYADKFHSKFPMRFNSIDDIRKDLARYGDYKVTSFDAMLREFGEPDLKAVAEAFEQKV